MYHPPATESDYHECLDWVEDSIEGVAACPFLRIAPEGRWLPPGAIDLSDTPGSAWSENSGGRSHLQHHKSPDGDLSSHRCCRLSEAVVLSERLQDHTGRQA